LGDDYCILQLSNIELPEKFALQETDEKRLELYLKNVLIIELDSENKISELRLKGYTNGENPNEKVTYDDDWKPCL
jgi:hypothetical protein